MSFQIKYIYNLVDRISPQLRKIEGNLRKTERQLQRTARKSNAAFNRMEKSTKSLTSRAILPLKTSMGQLLVTFAGVAGIAKTIGVLVSFGKEMAKVKAFTGATSGQMLELRNVAKKLGITTEFTAGQAAGALALLAKSGFGVNEIIAAIPVTLDLATAGALDLATATDITAKTLRGFNLPATQTERIANALAIAASSGNTTIGELGEAMKFIAPIASLSNLSIERVSATLSVLADNSLAASLGGTGLRRVVSELANPTKEAIRVFKRLGLTQEDIDVKNRGLMAVMKSLLPLVEDVGSAFKVFGDRGTPAFAVIAKNIDKIERLNKEMVKSKSAGKDLAIVMRDQLGGDLKALLSSVEGNIIKLGEAGLTGSLRGATQAATIFFRALSGGEKSFDQLGFTAKVFVSILKSLGSIIGFVLKVFAIGFKVALDTLNALLEGVMILIKPFLQLNDLIARGLGKGFDFGKNLFGGNTNQQNINTTNTINTAQANQRQEPQQPLTLGGRLDVNLNNLPRGSNANFTPDPQNNLAVGINQTFARR